MPLSATETVSPAIDHVKKQLMQPFRFWQWTRLAFVGMLAGELGSSGGCNVPTNFQMPQSNSGSDKFLDPGLWNNNPALLAGLITAGVIVGLVLWVVFVYLNSRMRFVLFDSVINKECRIGEYWHRRREPANRYFVWQLLFGLAVLGGVVILLGIPAGIAFALGWIQQPSAHVLPLVLGGILLFFVFAVFIICAAVVGVMTKDFVVPYMVVEDVTPVQGWRRLLPVIKTEKGSYAGYIGFKIVLAIAAAFISGFATLILFLIVAIVVGVFALVIWGIAAGAGLHWNTFTIALAVIAGIILFAALFCAILLINVPMAVFFPAYSLHFLASRYPGLDALLHPAPPAPPPPPAPEIPPPMPPFLPPEPSPLGS